MECLRPGSSLATHTVIVASASEGIRHRSQDSGEAHGCFFRAVVRASAYAPANASLFAGIHRYNVLEIGSILSDLRQCRRSRKSVFFPTRESVHEKGTPPSCSGSTTGNFGKTFARYDQWVLRITVGSSAFTLVGQLTFVSRRLRHEPRNQPQSSKKVGLPDPLAKGAARRLTRRLSVRQVGFH